MPHPAAAALVPGPGPELGGRSQTTTLRLLLHDPPRIARLRWVVGPCGVAGPDESAGPDRMPDAITKKPRFSLRRTYVSRAAAPLRLHPNEASLSHASHFSEAH